MFIFVPKGDTEKQRSPAIFLSFLVGYQTGSFGFTEKKTN